MSFSSDGRRVICDGEGCTETASLPVSLRRVLDTDKDGDSQNVDGWLFSAQRGQWWHYCPKCLPKYLAPLSRREYSRESDL